jgi:hypothetical protein
MSGLVAGSPRLDSSPAKETANRAFVFLPVSTVRTMGDLAIALLMQPILNPYLRHVKIKLIKLTIAYLRGF